MERKVTIRNEEYKKNLLTRLKKIEGQVRGVSKMLEDNRYCDEILIQLSAIDKSIKSLANLLLESHLKSCVKTNIVNGNDKILDELLTIITRFQ